MRTVAGFLAIALLLVMAAPALAQDGYPSRMVKIVVSAPPGGGPDIVARVIADRLSKIFGQPFVVENHPGAGGRIGAEAVALAEPNGYTLLAAQPAPLTTNGVLYKRLGYDPTAFEPLAIMTSIPNTLTVRADFPAASVAELIAYAKANPGKVAYASAGPGSTNHLCAALFEKMADVQMVHVPYRGGAPAVADTVGGQTQLFFTAGTQSLEHVKAGKLRLLAVTEGKRSSLLPDVPTVGETVPGYEMSVWYGAFGPAGMARTIVAKLNAEISRILFLPDVKKKMEDIAVEVAKMKPEELGTLTHNDADKWGKLIKELGVTAQ